MNKISGLQCVRGTGHDTQRHLLCRYLRYPYCPRLPPADGCMNHRGFMLRPASFLTMSCGCPAPCYTYRSSAVLNFSMFLFLCGKSRSVTYLWATAMISLNRGMPACVKCLECQPGHFLLTTHLGSAFKLFMRIPSLEKTISVSSVYTLISTLRVRSSLTFKDRVRTSGGSTSNGTQVLCLNVIPTLKLSSFFSYFCPCSSCFRRLMRSQRAFH